MTITVLTFQPVVYEWPARFVRGQSKGRVCAISSKMAMMIAVAEADKIKDRVIGIDSVVIFSESIPVIRVSEPQTEICMPTGCDMLDFLKGKKPDEYAAMIKDIPHAGTMSYHGSSFHYGFRVWVK